MEVPRQEFIDLVDEMIGDAGTDVTQVGFRIETIEFCSFNHGMAAAPSPPLSDPATAIFPSERHTLFILPMSAMKWMFITVGIHISAKRSVFAASSGGRPVGFCRS